MAAIEVTHYTVEGSGFFPFDMLRYDGSYPDGPESVAALGALDAQTSASTRSVSLAHVGEGRRWLPTFGRWRSFGWVVTTVRGIDTSERRA